MQLHYVDTEIATMRMSKIALFAALAALPLTQLNAGVTAPSPSAPETAIPAELIEMQNAGTIADGTEVQGWGCCFIFFMGRWYCVPC